MYMYVEYLHVHVHVPPDMTFITSQSSSLTTNDVWYLITLGWLQLLMRPISRWMRESERGGEGEGRREKGGREGGSEGGRKRGRKRGGREGGRRAGERKRGREGGREGGSKEKGNNKQHICQL